MRSNPINKQALRASALASRQQLSVVQREEFSATIMARLQSHLSEQAEPSGALLAYRAMPSEVNADLLFELPEFQLFAPVTHHHEHMEWREVAAGTGWSHGVFGILEPDSERTWQGGDGITTLLCPLSAFDRMGNRLGMGKGCFDFWLASHRKDIYQVIGLAFACQEVAEIPAEGHDVPMDFVITEKEIIRCPKR
ncbi:5-formyltetrahydrofolate cyclo-ligase [Mariprofundus aestuarium]|uniref:5-formyltetrahydrofolate cyclo-ligase n=1 Tax=Mariprofundus aestuarium TaxID=1921086 RepID=A0A2K8L3G9_MARES|nr:5-formyltetrahydrofolate cyclo-ligase [Mariprofundus aestuarium]ATX80769.1 5-formyltetrahydrofolate cyclo-ligase [Mariprofundus aestuarium]